MTLTQVLLLANLLALAGLGAWLWMLQRQSRALRASVDALAADAGALPADLRSAARTAGIEAGPFYTLEILNPLEVAARQSRLGAVFGGLTPALVRGEVYRQAHGIIRDQLAQRGIKADLRLHAR